MVRPGHLVQLSILTSCTRAQPAEPNDLHESRPTVGENEEESLKSMQLDRILNCDHRQRGRSRFDLKNAG